MSSVESILDHKEFLDGIKHYEGRFPMAYKDPKGLWTIGYGHLVTKREQGIYLNCTLTDEEMEALLIKDLTGAAKDAQSVLRGIDTRPNQWRAMTDWVFNLGVGNLIESTLRKLYNLQDFPAAARQINRWTKCTINGHKVPLKGLIRRRQWETNIFLDGNYEIVE